MSFDPSKLIFNLTVEDLIKVLTEAFPQLAGGASAQANAQEEDGPTFKGRICYSLNEAARFFQVSHKTICTWKKTWLRPAIKQNGRKIMMDVEYALKLYNQREVE